MNLRLSGKSAIMPYMWIFVIFLMTAQGDTGALVLKQKDGQPAIFPNEQVCMHVGNDFVKAIPTLKPTPKTAIPACIFIPDTKKA